MNLKKSFLTFAVVFTSVVSTYFATISIAQQAAQPAPKQADNEYQIAAVLYQQHAAEYRALAFQAFNLARLRIDEDFDKKNLKRLAKDERKKPRAVVVDIDETVLDNSPQQADLIKSGYAYNDAMWADWVRLSSAKAIPGAVEFLRYANRKGVRVFYVSNRDDVLKKETMKNLTDLNFPDVSEENVMLLTDKSTKEPRRRTISQKYRIVLLVGDNLDDFTESYEKKSIADRFAVTEADENLFGKKYVVLPNAMYGTWERAIYDYKNLDVEAKKQKQLEMLGSYK